MRKIIPDPETPLCPEDDHTWKFQGYDPDIGMNGAWVCTDCNALDSESPPPSDEDDY